MKQQRGPSHVCSTWSLKIRAARPALPWTDSGWPDARGVPAADSAAAVAALYQNHAVGLIRLAYLMLGDRAGAEDADPGCLLRPS